MLAHADGHAQLLELHMIMLESKQDLTQGAKQDCKYLTPGKDMCLLNG